MTRLLRNPWSELIPFLDYELEIRRVICSTNAVKSLNSRSSGRSRPAVTSQQSKQR
jgi:transposase-like protein